MYCSVTFEGRTSKYNLLERIRFRRSVAASAVGEVEEEEEDIFRERKKRNRKCENLTLAIVRAKYSVDLPMFRVNSVAIAFTWKVIWGESDKV